MRRRRGEGRGVDLLIKNTHFYSIGLPPPTHEPDIRRERENEKERQKGKKKDNLKGNLLLHFVSSDFEIRLEVTQVNEKK